MNSPLERGTVVSVRFDPADLNRALRIQLALDAG